MARSTLNLTISLENIHCYDEGDGPGNAEPYLWPVFFKIDGDSYAIETGSGLIGFPIIESRNGHHANLGNTDVDEGDDVSVPESLGTWRNTLKPIPINDPGLKALIGDDDFPGIAGVAVVLMEEDNWPDDLADTGYRALVDAIRLAVAQVAAGFQHATHAPTKEEIDAAIQTVKDTAASMVHDAIKGAMSGWQLLWYGTFGNNDDTIGSEVWTADHDDFAQQAVVPFSRHWSGDESEDGDWSISGAFRKTDWQRFELAPAEGASTNGAIAAVSRIPNSMEIWWVGANGSVQGAFWYEGAQWQQYELAPAGSASPNGGITAVSRIPNSLEVWWIGANGSVQDAFWYEGQDGWRRFEITPAGSASPNGGITAVSRIPNSLEVWWIGANGSVQDAFWYEGQDGWRRFEIAPAGSASPNGGITAVSRIPNSLEVWWIGANGSVQDAFWYEGQDGWRRFEIAPAGSASPNGGIIAVSRIPNSLEIWWVGGNGSIQDAFWYEGQDDWRRFEIAPAGSASPNGGITAVSRIPNSMEIWWVGANGSVQDAFWYEGQDGWRQLEIAPAGTASSKGGITTLSRIPNSMEIWWVGGTGSIQDAFWYA